jgi:hypothetical protein
MDIDRVRFLLLSYHRARLSKLQRFCFFFCYDPQGQQQVRSRMSAEEREFYKKFLYAKGRLLSASVLQRLPEAYRGMEDVAPALAQGPLSRLHHVYATVRAGDVPDLPPDVEEGETQPVEMSRGRALIMQYGRPGLAELVFEGKVELG